ncbi:MAG: Aminodeoxychorismate lyase [Acidimicrobiales bacterium]|nr:Aminodeoxychorismate lyase [Acidimicrobiales bacterium]
MSTWVWTDGVVSAAADARISALDRGVLLGDGVYETCKVVDGAPFALTRHLGRLRQSAEIVAMALPWSDSLIRSACAKAVGAALVDPAGDGTVGRLRITVTGGTGALGPDGGRQAPTLIVAAGPGRTWGPTTDVVTADWPLNHRRPTSGAKATSYLDNLLALAEAHRRDADETILANTDGALAEGAGSNVFLVVDGHLCTPSLATGCLAGVTRALVCEAVDVEERDDLTLEDLRTAPEAFLTSSTRDVHPIARVDGQVLRAVPGPRTTAAAEAFAAIVARTIDP